MDNKVLIGIIAVVAVVVVVGAVVAVGLGGNNDDGDITEGVKYYPNGGTGSKDHVSITSHTVMKNLWFTYEGKDFSSWNTKADGTGQTYMPDDNIDYKPQTTVNLYAQWTDSTTFHVTSFFKGGLGVSGVTLNGESSILYSDVYATGNMMVISFSSKTCSNFSFDTETNTLTFDYTAAKTARLAFVLDITGADGVYYEYGNGILTVGFKAVSDVSIVTNTVNV